MSELKVGDRVKYVLNDRNYSGNRGPSLDL